MICRNCWESFLANISTSIYVPVEAWKDYVDFHKVKIKAAFPSVDSEEKTMYLIDYLNPPSQEEFEMLKKNKNKYLFIRKRYEWQDEQGFSHVQ